MQKNHKKYSKNMENSEMKEYFIVFLYLSLL